MEKRIVTFIKKHHVLTLATSLNGQAWCAHCFYTFLEDQQALVFTSSHETRHIQEASQNPQVAGAIALETSVLGKIQGVQFSGSLTSPSGELLQKAHHAYLLRFPFAALMDTHLWVLHINYLKMTDNRLGFGKKLIWKRN